VVLDGADERTIQALAQFEDSRLYVVTLPQSVGAQEARNVGVRSACGWWVAFWDDDDEWLPAKLERQIEAAHASRWNEPVVSPAASSPNWPMAMLRLLGARRFKLSP
jgi:glycosyltransferase involved in cell wall biosynthesis